MKDLTLGVSGAMAVTVAICHSMGRFMGVCSQQSAVGSRRQVTKYAMQISLHVLRFAPCVRRLTFHV